VSEELDPKIADWFAAAEQRLEGDDFTARLALPERRWWAIEPWRIGTAVLRGLVSAIGASLRLRPALAGLAATIAVAVTIGLVLQS
jgi:hypothetical protein